MTVEAHDKDSLLREYYGGADTGSSQYKKLVEALNGSEEFCVFTTESSDTSGLSTESIPSLQGKSFTLIVDVAQKKLVHVEEGVQVS